MANHKALRLNEERVFKEGFMAGLKMAGRVLGTYIEEDAAELLFEKFQEGIEELEES